MNTMDHIQAPQKFDMTLIYTTSPTNGGLVFAEPERALLISRINDALSESKTWSEFRRAMPKDEYEKIMQQAFDDEELPRPEESEEFDASVIPGYCDGDYPAWLQQEMDEILPDEIIERFAREESTALNGTYLHIDPDDLPAIQKQLQQMGYTLEDGRHLSFF